MQRHLLRHAIALGCLVVSTAVACSPSPTLPTETTTPSPVLSGETWVFGDSLTTLQGSWPSRLSHEVISYGTGGSGWYNKPDSTIESIPNSVRRLIDLRGVPERIILTGGVNDESHGDSLSQLTKEATALLNELSAYPGLEVIFVTPPPRRDGPYLYGNGNLLGPWRNWWRTNHASMTVDCAPRLGGWPYPSTANYTDALHPNAAGYTLYAACVDAGVW